MKYHPKLKIAIEEIKAILQKHDIAGMVVIHTPGFAEFMLEISPSYSCARMEGPGIRFRAKKSDFNGDAKARDQKISDTTNMLHNISQMGGNASLQLLEMSNMLDNITKAEHSGSGLSSHESQNN